jgi:cysteine-rich repeat protein
LLLLACTPATNGIADGETDETAETGDGDGEPTGDGDGEPTGDGDGDGDGDNTCTQIGCDCDGTRGSCDPTLMCIDGTCIVFNCGNAAVDAGEECDDGNQVDGDGCDNDCSETMIQQVAAGGRHTCALIEGGRVRCWGEAGVGAVGLGNEEDIGDDETPAESMDVPLPGAAIAIDSGELHVCASFDDDALRCWGLGASGQLGNSSTAALGDSETLEALPGIDLGDQALSQFSLGGAHACARFADASIRCWGRNNDGQLGIGSTQNIGDDEVPGSIGAVTIAPSIAAAAGGDHSCAITNDLELVCWGRNDHGQLGYGHSDTIGNDPGESPQTGGKIELYPALLPNGALLSAVSLGKEHSCALFDSGDVVCWGRNDNGELGQGDAVDWGDDNSETPSMLPLISLGGSATAISAGLDHSCALLEGGDVRCWGRNDKGQLGLGQLGVDEVGDDELPSDVATVVLGAPAVAISAGSEHNCALLETNEIVCWGDNTEGRLGYGHTIRIGDDETPGSEGAVPIF